MSQAEKELVRRVAMAYVATAEPAVLEELETVFEATYSVLAEPGEGTPGVRWIHGRLQADSPFVEPSPSAEIIWITTELVRALSGEDAGRDLRAVAGQVGDRTGQLQRVTAIAAILEQMQAEMAALRRTVNEMAGKLDRLAPAPAGEQRRREDALPPFPLPEPSKAWTSKKEHSRLSWQLANIHGSAFVQHILPLLRLIWPQTLGGLTDIELDGEHLVGGSEPSTRLVVLGLGLEEDEERMEPRAACAAIERFAHADLESHSYLVVHNRTGRNPRFRHAIETALTGLVAAGRVRHAELWDRQRLLREAFNAMLRHTLARLPRQNLPIAAFETFYEDPRLALETVPLRMSTLLIDQHQLKTTRATTPRLADPAAAILERSESNFSVLIGEFGSGKTTAVVRALEREPLRPVYVSGATISGHIVGTKDFLQRCIPFEQLLAEFPEDDHEMLGRLARPVVEYVFKDATLPVVLILDGLDESAFLARRGGFQHLFNLLHEVRVPVILTMRSEFWERGQGEFAAVFGRVARHGERRHQRLRMIELLPWSAEQIGALVRRYRQRVTERRGRKGCLMRKRSVACCGNWSAVIPESRTAAPRRPPTAR